MSGGSYNYLCFDDDVYALAGNRDGLQGMRERLAELPWARAASDETERICAALERLDSVIRNATSLRDVWLAIEWWDSCDYSEDQAREAVRRYEGLL